MHFFNVAFTSRTPLFITLLLLLSHQSVNPSLVAASACKMPISNIPPMGQPYALCDNICVADTTTACVSPAACSDTQICWGGFCKDKRPAADCCAKSLFSSASAAIFCNGAAADGGVSNSAMAQVSAAVNRGASNLHTA